MASHPHPCPDTATGNAALGRRGLSLALPAPGLAWAPMACLCFPERAPRLCARTGAPPVSGFSSGPVEERWPPIPRSWSRGATPPELRPRPRWGLILVGVCAALARLPRWSSGGGFCGPSSPALGACVGNTLCRGPHACPSERSLAAALTGCGQLRATGEEGLGRGSGEGPLCSLVGERLVPLRPCELPGPGQHLVAPSVSSQTRRWS